MLIAVLIAEIRPSRDTLVVTRIHVLDPRLRTKDGIGVGSTYSDLRSRYTIDWVGSGEGDFFARSSGLGSASCSTYPGSQLSNARPRTRAGPGSRCRHVPYPVTGLRSPMPLSPTLVTAAMDGRIDYGAQACTPKKDYEEPRTTQTQREPVRTGRRASAGGARIEAP
jgi:hypothetical protein